MIDTSNEVKKLVEKAAAAKDSADAMRFSQAACNAANAMCAARDAMTKGGAPN